MVVLLYYTILKKSIAKNKPIIEDDDFVLL